MKGFTSDVTGLPPLADYFNLNDFPGNYRAVAEVIGIQEALLLAQAFGGCPLHIPKLDRLLVPARDRRINKEHDGSNTMALARRYGLSRRHVQAIIAKQESTA